MSIIPLQKPHKRNNEVRSTKVKARFAPCAVRKRPLLGMPGRIVVVDSLTLLFMGLVQCDQNFLKTGRILTPRTQRARRFSERYHPTHRLFHRKSPAFQQLNHGMEVFRLSIPRSENIQFFLNKHPRLIGHRFFGIPDVNNPAGKCDFFDRRPESLWRPDCFDHNIRTASPGHFLQPFVQRFPPDVNRAGGACQFSEFELFFIHVDTDGASTPGTCSSYRSEPHSSTSENCDAVFCRDSPARHSMKSHRQRLNQAEFLCRQLCRIELLSRHRDEFSERSVPLHAESLVELAGIRTSTPARRTLSAACVRRYGNIRSYRQFALATPGLQDLRRHFMPKNPGIRD